MNLLMPIGRDDFADVRKGFYFVDKTAFLKHHAQVTLFTRPRRFGKTLTLSMMRYFLDIEGAEEHRALFDGLAIAQDAEAMAEQGARPGKPVLLLDEYDVPVQSAWAHGYYDEAMGFFRELRSLFRAEVIGRYQSDEMSMDVPDLMRAFVMGDVETARYGLAEYLEVLTSGFDAQKGKESFYHGFVLGLTATLTGNYQIRSNHESGYGRYDIAAFPKQAGGNGMIIKCKRAESESALETEAQAALRQIAERDYDAEFRAQGVETVLHYGIAFYGKRVQVAI
ncbi:AAA family ATPase [Selenomonas sp.]|uniref:AAA family ATPase n=1 Tax=Selenomonas sp. TaxID=2053611 RepID=UPI002A809113|nr:AAA family ATPase [Selenomonas sp.]MDY4416670.1 AAA family ATPase [Selenomonas sp.]